MASIFARIQNATDHEVRTVLAGLCADSTNKRYAEKLFDRLDQTAKAYGDRKLAVPTLDICLNCKQAYNEAQNAANACHYHSGIIEINHDSEAWVDCWGDEIHDSEEMREDLPEGFMWSCCEKDMDAPGCMRGSHKQGRVKRPRTTTAATVQPAGESATKRTRCVASGQNMMINYNMAVADKCVL
ncbi:hypothetical protein C8A00DRAFT_16291 [Chaetomidium leptoderma]|uniref:Uncharacterized protein n=1 Tax=Chaetomidium leptoderma TaxID=669021 RepID=A0AAN6VLG4_9PEZI|nr:hypothetical protein C8A00DRAFT_16291 [Chaetomidium leptoderma]